MTERFYPHLVVLESSQRNKLQHIFFKDVAHTTIMRRLRKLEAKDVVLRLKGLPNALSAWCLTKTGASLIAVSEPSRYFNQNVIQHEVTLSELRLCLEQMGLGTDWTSETDIRKQFSYSSYRNNRQEQIIPDGIFTVTVGSPSVVAVELELTPKSHLRYQKILSQYARKDSIRWIWYVVKTKSNAQTVISQWQRIRRFETSPVLMYSLLEDVLTNKDQSQISFLSGAKRTLSEHFNLKTLLNESMESAELPTQGVSKLNENLLSMGEEKIVELNQKLNSASIPQESDGSGERRK